MFIIIAGLLSNSVAFQIRFSCSCIQRYNSKYDIFNQYSLDWQNQL